MSNVTPQKDQPPGGKRRMTNKEPVDSEDGEVLDDGDLENLDKEEEEEVMLMVSHQKDANGVRPKVGIEREAILLAYVKAANEVGIDEVVPKNIGCRSQFGPYYVYGVACDLKKIVDHVPTMEVMGPAPEKKPYVMDVKLLDLNDDGSIHSSAMAKCSVHLIINLKPGAEARFVPIGKLKQFFKDQGFIVFKVQRQKVKLNNVVTTINTESIHLNVMPTKSSIAAIKWPVLRIEVPSRGRDDGVRVFFPEYKICSHNELPSDEKFCRRCHVTKPCQCGNRKDKKQKPSADGTMSLIAKAMASGDWAVVSPCHHYLSGRCNYAREGVVCGFTHDPTKPPGSIPCAREFPGGGCPNGKTCMYLHKAEKMAD